MIHWIRDLPDWMTGSLLAGALWFSSCYVVLAPRAMQGELESEIYPICIAQLEADQDRAILNATQKARRSAESERSAAFRELRARQRELAEAKNQLTYYNSVRQAYQSSGLGSIIKLPTVDVPSIGDVEQMEQAIRKKAEALRLPIEITLPRAPSNELMETCACAAMKTLVGERTNYAISLASFRVISPTDISAVKQGVAEKLRMKTCGIPSWETLS